jgi:D-alanyl-D-alanine carboxypeptidase
VELNIGLGTQDRMFIKPGSLLLLLTFLGGQAIGGDIQVAGRIDEYIRPYVESGNFSGSVLVRKDGRTIFQRAYGLADREHRVPNENGTRFHVASVSMQFTAAAILRLVDAGSISLDTHVGEYVRGIQGADKITVRDLLTERSGLPDINDLSDYADILQHHQTPADLVARIEGRPLLFEPGSKFLHEEHSAYNLLALIVEKKTGLPFASAVHRLVLGPAGLKSSGVDDDYVPPAAQMAIGYEPDGVKGLKLASPIHWSAKTGNGSVYTTVADHSKWVDGLFGGHLLKAPSLHSVLDTSQRVGYGWFRGTNSRFDQTAYYMNGRAPGFASFVLYLPRERLIVVVFSNIYSSATTTIGYDVAAVALGRPYTPFRPSTPEPDARYLESCTGTFKFGDDFYQPNARIRLISTQTDLSLGWPSGDVSPLIPLDRDHFMDRSYWEEIKIERNNTGQPIALTYGRFRGSAGNSH